MMMTKRFIFLLACLCVCCKANENEVSLICPEDFGVQGQAWYVEKTINVHIDNAKELVKKDSRFKQTSFLVCLVCLHKLSSHQTIVEICAGKESDKKKKVKLSMKSNISEGTLDWHSDDSVGIKVDVSEKSTLTSIQPETDSSSQNQHFFCPNGFKLDKFTSEKPDENGTNKRRCIICSKNQVLISACVMSSKDYFNSNTTNR